MNRNQKIAVGCGGAGCLGLIVLVVVCAVAAMVYLRRPGFHSTNSNSNFNVNTNPNLNNESSRDSEDETSSSLSENDKHKLFQAAAMTQDTELMQRVWKKLGLMSADGTTTGEYEQFVKDHFRWAMKNLQFVNSVNTPEKARAYVDERLDD